MSNKNAAEIEQEGLAALQALEEQSDEAPGSGAPGQTQVDRRDKSPDEVMADLSEAQIAQILDRGIVGDRLSRVTLPPDRVGYWVRERADDIDRYKALGGRLERSSEVGTQGLHGTGDDLIRVGDVVLMSLPRRVVEVIGKLDRKNKASLKGRGKSEFLGQKVPGVPHYEEV